MFNHPGSIPEVSDLNVKNPDPADRRVKLIKKPIELQWCCGVNPKIDVIDLTTQERVLSKISTLGRHKLNKVYNSCKTHFKDRTHTVAFAANHLVVIQVI